MASARKLCSEALSAADRSKDSTIFPNGCEMIDDVVDHFVADPSLILSPIQR